MHFLSKPPPTLRKLVSAATSLGMALGLAGAVQAQPACPAAGTTVLYVAPNASTAAQGSSWADAMDLQAALAKANADTSCLDTAYDIRVQQGTYKPTTLSTAEARATSFAINRPLQLRGGYTGNGDERLPNASATVLSGALGNGFNSYHVVVVGGTDIYSGNGRYDSVQTSRYYTLLDGFTVSDGNADSNREPANTGGGGLLCNGSGSDRSCSPALNNLHFSNNQAAFGGALNVIAANAGTAAPQITNSSFDSNTASVVSGGILLGIGGTGGAINTSVSESGSQLHLTIADTSFTGNSAQTGGAMYIDASQLGMSLVSITGAAFIDNKATTNWDSDGKVGRGGAIYHNGSLPINDNAPPATLSIATSRFESNTSTYSAGAIGNDGRYGGSASLTVTDSTFNNNTSGTVAGAILNDATMGTTVMSVASSTFSGNSSQNNGGAIYNDGFYSGSKVDVSIVNSSFKGNMAAGDSWGGAMYTYIYGPDVGSTGTVKVASSTFHNNKAQNGQALLNNVRELGTADIQVSSSIFSDDSGAEAGLQVVDHRQAKATVNNSLLPQAWSGAGQGNRVGDAKLGPLKDRGGPTFTMLPGAGSPAIDAIACTDAPARDQRGISRPQGAQCDIGSVEAGTVALTVAVSPPGAGTVTASTAPPGATGVNQCGSASGSCTATYQEADPGAVVSLSAQTAVGYTLAGWSDNCTAGVPATTCLVSMDKPQAVSANFRAFTLTPGAMAHGMYGTAYNQPLSVSSTGGAGAVSYRTQDGNNTSSPAGLVYTPASGTVTGPAHLAPGDYSFTVLAADANGASTQPHTITVTIEAAPLLIQPRDAAIAFGQPIPPLAIGYQGFVNGDNAAALDTPATAATTASAGSPAGSYPITASGASSSHYRITYKPGTLSIGKVAQSIEFTSTPPQPAQIGGTYLVTTTQGPAAQPVVLAASGACSMNGTTVTFNAKGNCTITADQAGDANHAAAPTVRQQVAVGLAQSAIHIDTAAPNPSVAGQTVEFKVSVSQAASQRSAFQTKAIPLPTGTVTLADEDGTTLASAALQADGVATLTVTSLTQAGTHNIVASYSGDDNYATSSSTAFIHTVTAAAIVATPVPLLDTLWAKLLLALLVLGLGALGKAHQHRPGHRVP